MKSTLLKAIDSDQVEEFKSNFKTSYLTRVALCKYLEVKLKEVRDTAMNKTSYDKASWPFLQADSIGYQRACEDLKKVLLEK